MSQQTVCHRCRAGGWVCEDHPHEPMGHRLPDGRECGGAGDPCGDPECAFRPQLTLDDDPGSCELVAWRDGSRRCELWNVGGTAFLRLYQADTLLWQEPAEPARAYYRAQELRGMFTG